MNVRIIAVLLTGIVAAGAAYAKKYPLTAASEVPGARGKLETGKDRNGNTKLKLEAEHLAEPGKLSPPRTAYVVWLQEKGAEPASQGQLRVDKNLKAKFESTTPAKSFDLFVTAESDPGSRLPGGTEVFRVSVQD